MSKDIDDLLLDLAAAQTAGRTPEDRFQEFRALFLGSDAGKRVLHDIVGWGRLYGNPIGPDTHETYRRLGERNLALKVLATITMPPSPHPARQQSKPKNEGE